MKRQLKSALKLVRDLAVPGMRISSRIAGRNRVNFDQAPAPIFIIGGPRTGSTILYQALTNFFDVLYIDNLACGLNKDLFFGLSLSRKLFGAKPHNCFNAKHGQTDGWHAPSECGAFWYRWLPRDRHFVDHEDVSTKSVREIQGEVLAASARFRLPLLFKNLNAGQRLRLLSKAFPEARFVFIRRDPETVVKSMLRARADNGVGANKIWSVRPRNYKALETLPEAEMCLAQLLSIEAQILEDLALFPSQNVRTLSHSELSAEAIKGLGDWLKLTPRAGGALPEFDGDVTVSGWEF